MSEALVEGSAWENDGQIRWEPAHGSVERTIRLLGLDAVIPGVAPQESVRST